MLPDLLLYFRKIINAFYSVINSLLALIFCIKLIISLTDNSVNLSSWYILYLRTLLELVECGKPFLVVNSVE